jgi:urea transport system ATP-binding protein
MTAISDGEAADALLQVQGLQVVFDGFRAIDGLDFSVDRGEARFLIGPNGAGKTTLVDAITGLTRPEIGSVRFGGEEVLGKREHEIVRLGIDRTFQTPSVFEELSVLNNVDLAASYRRPLRSLLRGPGKIDDRVVEVLETVGLSSVMEQAARTLSHGQKQWLEIGMVLVQEPQLLLLDEPVAGMTKEERTATGELIQRITETRTVVVIEHDMDFVRRFASRVTVMHEGSVLTEGTVAEIQDNPLVEEVYLGRPRDARGAAPAAVGQGGQ